jgi:hypothetical protein
MWLVLRDVSRAAAVATAAPIVFFAYQYVVSGLHHLIWRVLVGGDTGYFWIWVFLALLILVAAGWKWKKGKEEMTAFLNVAGAVLILLPTYAIVTGLFQIRSQLAALNIPPAGPSMTPVHGDAQPDIFYVILDGYGREDALKSYLGYSNHSFIKELEKRNFYIADQSRSNYCQTELSLASSLNMNFVSNLVDMTTVRDNMDRAPLDRLLDQSYVSRYLKEHGYDFISITSGFPGVHPSSSDILLSGPATYSLFESSLLNTTPFEALPVAESAFDARREHLVGALDDLSHFGRRGPKPRFVFAHVLAPHPPFVIGPEGQPVRKHGIPFGYWDASAYFTVGGTPRSYHDGYLGQLQYVNKRILEIVDHLAKQSPAPIIILQGDHGSRMHLDQASLAKSDVREAFRNFNCYLVPERVRKLLYPGITPVNAFRVLFNGLYDAKFPLMPDTSYFTAWETPYSPVDVTKQVLKPLDPPARSPVLAIR